MKRIKIFFVLMLLASVANAQNVAINADGSRPNKNAMLDIKSNTKGLLIPRMTTDARLKIEPTQGLMVYDINTNSFWYNDGKLWKNMAGADMLAATGPWLVTGNAGTDATNFLGTIDNVPLNIRVNNWKSGSIDHTRSNTSWGYQSALQVTNGFDNTAMGAYALMNNVIGNRNTAIGTRAMLFNVVSDGNVAIGSSAMIASNGASQTTAVGTFSLSQMISGQNNTAVGYSALGQNWGGSENTAVGIEALGRGRGGHRNTAVGSSSLLQNLGNDNTAIGFESLNNSQVGDGNTAAGYRSLFNNRVGTGNVAIGYEALYNNNTGYGNVGVGPEALISNVSGIYNTGLGVFANVLTPDLRNATVIGYNAVVDASNKVRIGNASVTVIEGQVPFTTPSDARFKSQVRNDVKGLDFIMELNPVTYFFDTKKFDLQFESSKGQRVPPGDEQRAMDIAYEESSRIRRSGFIAQDVELAAKKAGYNFSGLIAPGKEQQYYSLSYDAFVVPLVKAMQEQQQLIDNLHKELSALKQEMAEMKKLLQSKH